MSYLMAHVGVLTRPDGTEIKGDFVIVSEFERYRDKKIESLRAELAEKDRRIEEAESLIAEAVEIMTPEQVGRWAGVRVWQEGIE